MMLQRVDYCTETFDILLPGGPGGAEADSRMICIDTAPPVAEELSGEEGVLLFGENRELLVGGTIDKEADTLCHEGTADALCHAVGMGGNIEIEIVFQERGKLDSEQTAFGQHAPTLLDAITEIYTESLVGDDHGLAKEGALLGASDIKDICQTGNVGKGDVAGATSETIAQTGTIDEERHGTAVADLADGSKLSQRIDGAQLGGEREIDEPRLYHVFVVGIGVMSVDGIGNLPGRYLAIHGRQGKHLMAAMLDGSRLVDVDVSRLGTQHALIGAEHRGDDGGIGLRATHQEVYLGIGSIAHLAHQLTGLFTPGIFAITAGLFPIGFNQTPENEGMAALVVVILKLNHGIVR